MNYVLQITQLLGINIILAASLNVINGYCGLFSIGHAGFFAVGAYTSAAASVLWFPGLAASHPDLALLLVVGVGALSAALAGLVIGVPCLRLTGDYLAIATVGFGEIIRIVLLNLESVGASRGFPGIPLLTGARLPLWILFFTALSLLAMHRLIRSSTGRAIISVREDEIAAQSMGIDVRFYKIFAFVLGAFFAGLAGALFAHYSQFLHPSNFTFMNSVMILLMIVVGGLGSQIGAVLGAIVVTLLPEVLRFNETLSGIRMLIFGAIMVLVVLIKPQGLMGLFHRRKKVGVTAV
ncbi:MAG TPA: branched-chain amino acid ABC transporter permease [Bdellovibrionota bacterium]|jgi:branched-chain amino acid transport system permease protein|nr:branched-chain amino acid ABC transporter permease [Bdellovibrionota bacterium]